MASWQEIERIRKDPNFTRALALHLLNLSDLSEWEVTFLESISLKIEVDEFTNRQAEKLLEIRDESEYVDTIGFARSSVRILVERCQLGHLDIPREDDEHWVLSLPKGTSRIRAKNIGRLLRCARDLYLIEDEDAA